MAETQAQNNPDWQEALDRIQQVRESGETTLDLSRLDIPVLPDEITSLAEQITTLDLELCEHLTSLQGVESLLQLTSLNLTWCESLTSLSEIESLTKLTKLDLSGCESLTSLSGIEPLTQLTELNLSRCENLTSLSGIEPLTQLTELDLRGCESLTSLSGIEPLTQLTELDLRGCESLTSLSGIEPLTQLTELDLRGCKSLTSLSGIEPLTQLTELDLSGCENLTSLSGIESLTKLTELDLSRCENLTSLSGIESLTKLTELDLSRCENLTSLSGIESLTKLTELDLSWYENLTNLSGLESLSQLTTLNLSRCDNLTNLSRIESLSQLTELDLSGCESLTSLSGIESLQQLTTLDLSGCDNLTDLSRIASLQQLTTLDLRRCVNLTNLSGIESLPQLTELDLSGCDSLTSLSGLKSLTQLTELDLSRCDNLTNLSGLESLSQLTTLNLSRCDNLTNLAGIESLPQLTELDLSGCESLISLSDIESLPQLTELDLSGCERLTSLSGIESLQQLTRLDLNWCDDLTSLSGIESLQKLTQLSLKGCRRLTHLWGIQSLTQLTDLDLRECESLISLKGIESLQQLTQLWLDGCQNLQDLVAIYHLEQLENLSLEGLHLTDVSPLTVFRQLKVLYLNDNQLEDISPLSQLPQLEQLFLKDNAINEVAQFRQFGQLEEIQLSGNPFTKQYQLQLPSEYGGIFEDNDFDEIQNLLFRLDDTGDDIHLPAKILFLGNHAAGKSSLVHYLQRGKLSKQQDSTHILDIQPYQLNKPTANKKTEKYADTAQLPDALFYDFGGQDYYHGIYRVFMSQQAITCLLWHEESNHNRLEEDSCQRLNRHFSLNYWLGYWHHAHHDTASAALDITKTASKKKTSETPLLLIQTRADRSKATPIANAPAINQHFISLQAEHSSRLQQTSLSYLHAQLDELIQSSQKTVPGANWYGTFLKKILAKHDNNKPNSWESDTVRNWIQHYKPTEPDQTLRARHLKTEFSQLHEQGLVLYYPKINPDKVWLNPMAFAHYVHHHILQQNTIEQDKGQVPVSTLENHDPDILKVLEQEKVIFLHPHGQPKYIIPNYLPLVDEDSAEYRLLTFGIQESFSFNLWFKSYLPLGLINQLICHFGNLPDDKKFWRDQLLFTLGRHHQTKGRVPSQVLIKLKFDDQLQVQVYLSNPDPEQRLRHTRYIYYVISSLYWDFKPCESINEFELYYQEFQRTGQILLSQEQLQDSKGSQSRKSEHKSEIDSQKTAEFQRIYHAPPADLLISLNGWDFITATQLSRLSDETRLPGIQLSGEKESGQKLIAVAPFSPFTHRRLHRMLKVFISYSHDDIDARRELQKYLINLERDGLIDIWQDGMINTGDDWHQSITGALDQADVVIMLVSQSFIASSYVHQVEMPKAMTLKTEGKAQIFPILLSQCDYQHWSIIPESVRTHITSNSSQQINAVPMGRFQFFPMNEAEQRLTPINRWQYPEDAWTQVANRLRALSKPA